MYIPTITIIGSVDNGKSTLIGSLLMQTLSVSPGIIEKTQKICKDEGIGFEPAYLVDYIREEREMKSTREWALAELKFGTDKILIIDTPGQMTLSKKMISGLTQANMTALILDIGEENYVKYNYYFRLLSFLNIQNYVVLINKVDLINYDEEKYNNYVKKLKENVSFEKNANIIPISALHGDNITTKSEKTPWFNGETLGDYLQKFINKKQISASEAILFPVQDVLEKNNPSTPFRINKKIALGKLLSGTIKKNDRLYLLKDSQAEETVCEKVYHLDKETTQLNAGENGALETQDNSVQKNNLFTNSVNNFDYQPKINARLYIIENFNPDDRNLSIRYLKFKTNISSIQTSERYTWQFEKIENIQSFSTNEFADVIIKFNSNFPFANQNIQKELPETKQIAIENNSGDLIAIGIITK